MARLLLVLALAAQAASSSPASFDSTRAWTHLERLVSHGPRPAGSPALQRNRDYIKAQLAALGVPVVEQAWEAATPVGRIRMVNLIATIAGESPNRLVIAGHYDTKRFRDIQFVGANDGGSSAAFLIELARVLKGRRNPLTMELLFLDGEEATVEWQGTDHTYGSRHYVDAARRGNTLASLKALVLVDMVADDDLLLKRDINSTPWLTDAVWSAARAQGLGRYFSTELTQIEDDHLPFIGAGIPAVDLIDLEYPEWHTADDTLAHVSARSLQVVGDALVAALPAIEARLSR